MNKNLTAKLAEWQGDLVMPTEWSGIYKSDGITELDAVECTQMSTAIVRIYTFQGFVIAADGLRLRRDGSIASRNVQKLFKIEEENKSIAYGLAGCAYMDKDNSAVFDFSVEVARVASSFTGQNPADLNRYALLLSDVVNESLEEAKTNRLIKEYPTCPDERSNEPGSTIVRLFLIGYYEGRPSWAHVRFWHENQELKSPSLQPEEFGLMQMNISGSYAITQLLHNRQDPRFGDPTFAAYRRVNAPEGTLAQAIEIAENYILACKDPAALEIDPGCASIGGHIHIATVTPDGGFQWVPRFEPANHPPDSSS